MSFKDHFSGHATAYREFRPSYPAALFEWLARVAPARLLAIDVATGNGQAAVGLAGHFEHVLATDASAALLACAPAHPRVRYRVETAESLAAGAATADLVTAAQAAHWFDWPRFLAAARSVLRRDGVLAIWCYERCTVAPSVDRLLDDFYRDVLGPYWPRERRHVEEGYRDLALPLQPVEPPPFAMEEVWRVGQMLGYLDTWSAVRRHRARTGLDPLTVLAAPLHLAWGAEERRVRWPLTLRAGRN